MLRTLPIAAFAFLVAAPAFAQGAADLPDRPIARTEVIAVVKRQFAAMDANHDGIVTEAEFEAYRAHQVPGEGGPFGHVGGHWFEHADAQGNGRVTLAEAEAHPLQLFDMADVNHDGVVSVQERKMATMMMSLTGH
jgi:Ca2+-binding EF-hand superfamily protein